MTKSILLTVITAALAAVFFTGCGKGTGAVVGGDADMYLDDFYDRLNGGDGDTAAAYALTVSVSPSGGGTVSYSNQQSYPAGTEVYVTATPNEGYIFAGWSGASNSANTIVMVTMNSDLVLTAHFQPDSFTGTNYTLSVSASPSAGGTVSHPSQQRYAEDSHVTVTATPNTGYEFTGWSGTGAPTPVTTNPVTVVMNGNLTLTANFQQLPVINGTVVPGTILAGKLTWLERSAESHNTYIVEVNSDETTAPYTFGYSGAINITVVLRGRGANRTVRLSEHGDMFTVRSNVTLILDNNITLQGHSGNTGSMVYVYGGALKMNAGSAITGNSGIGVNLYSGTFEMSGGTIANNTSSGVYVSSGTTFTMAGGVISGNTASKGGGVDVRGTFTMNGGTISNNASPDYGGGVYVDGTFTMRGGTITNNTAAEYGGGVYVNWANFTKTGGTVTGYNSDQSGGNVVKDYSGVLARRGHAVYAYSYSNSQRKETTSVPEENLSVSGSTFGGVWDQ